MKLYLIQHGLAVDKDIDPERPLSEQGRADVQRLADFAKQAGVAPQQFFHSGKLRAEQTAQILASTLGNQPIEVLEGINPNDALEAAIRFITQARQDTALVGHLPFMQRLASFLLCGNETTGFSFRPGTITCLEKSDGNWTLHWMVRPELAQ